MSTTWYLLNYPKIATYRSRGHLRGAARICLHSRRILALRNRLTFVNAQVALSALPCEIEIMSEELGWNRTRQREEFERGFKYLQGLGLAPGTTNNSVGEYPWDRKSQAGWTRWVTDGFWSLLGMHSGYEGCFSAIQLCQVRGWQS